MNIFFKKLLEISAGKTLIYAVDKFISTDFTKQYDEDILFEATLVVLTLSLAKGIEKIDINQECIKGVVKILRTFNVDISEMEISGYYLPVNKFINECVDFVKCEYDDRYRFMEALLYIFYYNRKNIKEYKDLIKVAAFLELKKSDFIYLINKYKGAKV